MATKRDFDMCLLYLALRIPPTARVVFFVARQIVDTDVLPNSAVDLVGKGIELPSTVVRVEGRSSAPPLATIVVFELQDTQVQSLITTT